MENNLMNLLACHFFLIVTVFSLRNVHMQSIQILENATFTFVCIPFLWKNENMFPSLLFRTAKEEKIGFVLLGFSKHKQLSLAT